MEQSFLEPLPHLLTHVFGSHAASASYQILNQHPDYCVLSIQLEHASVIVKLAGRASTMDADFERTAAIHDLLRTRTSVPVAEIVAVDTTYAQFPWRYLIQTRLQGTVWAQLAPQLDPSQLHAAYMQIGQAVAQMHNITFPAFGEIGTTGSISFVDALLQRAKRSIQQDHLRERFAEIIEDRRYLFTSITRSVLCHDDLHHYNVLFSQVDDSWQLAGILDFDKAWAGHHETDLARLDFWDNMMGAGFREAYTAVHRIDSGYEHRRLVYQLLWCLEYAMPTPRHTADLQRVCHALGIAPITLEG